MPASNFVQVQAVLARWSSPSSWDRLLQDDPLEPLSGEWVPAVNSTGPVALTISGTGLGCSNYGTFTVTSPTMGTLLCGPAPGEHWDPGNGSWPPFPRNHRERNIWWSIQRKLPDLIRRAEKKIGKRIDTPEWNSKFWKMITRRSVPHDRAVKKTRL
jgi:hypothetical protein